MCKEAKFIGTFRYDTATNTLIDVCKVELTRDILDAAIREHIFVYNCPRYDEGEPTFCGRVAWRFNSPSVFIGSWATQYERKIEELVKLEFHLPPYLDIFIKDPTSTPTVQDCLMYLDNAGWSELIDTRWRRQVEMELRDEFGDKLSEAVLKEAVGIVLSPDVDLPENEYEYLPDYYNKYKPARRLMIENLMHK